MRIGNLKNSLKDHPKSWMLVWSILILDLAVIFWLSLGFSIFSMIMSLIILAVGMGAIYLASREAPPAEAPRPVLSPEVSRNLGELMDEIRPVCDEIFAQEIDRITRPVLDHMRDDFASALSWLWQGGEDFLSRVQQAIYETRHVIHLVSAMNSDTVKMIQRLRYDMDILIKAVADIEKQQERDTQELDRFLNNKVNGLKVSMDREKEIFYDYVQKMLIERLNSEPEGEDTLELFNVSKLGEQFSNVVEKSVQARLEYFEKSVLYDLEQLAADIVGKLQKGTLYLMTTLKEIEDLLGKLLDEEHNESSLTLRKLADSRTKIVSLKEESNEIMLTLAWADILTEKRWQALQEPLMKLKDQVGTVMDEDYQKYVAARLDEELPDYYNMSRDHATAMVYKSLLDAELVYNARRSGQLTDPAGDGVYVLLEYLRPVEMMVANTVRFTAAADEKRRSLKERARKNEFQELFDRVSQELMHNYPDYLVLLDGLFPGNFNAFCNNPNVGDRPEDAGQAAWMVFLRLIESPELPSEFYLLVALLLYMHQVRKAYIHPLKSEALPLKGASDIEDVRNAALRIVKILMLYDSYKHQFV